MTTITNQTVFEFQQHDGSKNANDGIVHPAALAMFGALFLRPIGRITMETGSIIDRLSKFPIKASRTLLRRAEALRNSHLERGGDMSYCTSCKFVALGVSSLSLGVTGHATGITGLAIEITGEALYTVGEKIEDFVFHRLFGL